MPHIHTEPGQHDHTVSAYIVRLGGKEPRILLHRHKKVGGFMQFGGHIELNETPWQAITRELQEESGYELDQLTILQPKQRITKLTRSTSHPQPVSYNTHAVENEDKHFHTDIVYAFVTSQDPRSSPGGGESNDLRLFTRSELQNHSPQEIFEMVREIGQFVLDEPLNSWDKIPAKDI